MSEFESLEFLPLSEDRTIVVSLFRFEVLEFDAGGSELDVDG